ncbi:hypothetical protein Tco_0748182 [Tanacetum coccineum]|uniref:Uncharacterized protein n=1 Tax=Tanacetum coccineum TaxID=301880 RepID=A0ABQ4YW24_9ASTR
MGQNHNSRITSSRSGMMHMLMKQIHDAIYNEEPMAESDARAIRPLPAKLTDNMTTKLSDQSLESENTSTVHEKTTSPRSCLRWQPTGRILKTVCLRWVPTGKTFASSTTKVESEPPNGSNEDIPNQCESEQALNVIASTLLSTDQASVFMEKTSVHISSGLSSSKLVLTIPPSHRNAKDNSHKVVRLGINPMIQPEPEDLPKDNPKLEIAVLSMSMLVKVIRSQDGKDDKDNDKGSKSRSQSMKEQAYNEDKDQEHSSLNDKSNLTDLMKECHQ